MAHAARLARLKERELFQLVAANTTKNIIGSDRGGTLGAGAGTHCRFRCRWRAGPALHHFPEGRGGVNAQQGQHKGQQTTLTRHDLDWLDPVDTVLSRLLLLAYFNALRVLGEL